MDEVYDSTFLCTYNQLNDDDLYRTQFLQAFKCTIWDDTEITKKTDIVYNSVGSHFKACYDTFRTGDTRFTHLMMLMGQHFTDENLFRILFSMDLFSETHRCISDVVNAGSIKSDSIDALMKCIN
jgi:hypothetical protein